MSQMNQNNHSEIQMMSNTNMSKISQQNNMNMKKPLYDDDDQPSEESKSKLHIQMANTGYEGFGGP